MCFYIICYAYVVKSLMPRERQAKKYFTKNLVGKHISCYFELQSTFMVEQSHPLDTLQDIKQMMERSSRFISLSGLSGVAAGICALVGAGFAYNVIEHTNQLALYRQQMRNNTDVSILDYMGHPLLQIAILTFVAALISAFAFTYVRSRKNGIPIWGKTSRRLLVNVSVPLIAGGLYLIRLIEEGTFGLIAPGCLIFYGLALINASKYTLHEIRYLGYCELIIGLFSLYFVGLGLYFWALGFGVMHIVYGTAMWWKYERRPAA